MYKYGCAWHEIGLLGSHVKTYHPYKPLIDAWDRLQKPHDKTIQKKLNHGVNYEIKIIYLSHFNPHGA